MADLFGFSGGVSWVVTSLTGGGDWGCRVLGLPDPWLSCTPSLPHVQRLPTPLIAVAAAAAAEVEAFTGRTEEGRCGRAGAGLGKPKAGDGSDWWVLQRREQEKSSLAQWLLLAGAGGSFKFAELRVVTSS